MKKISILGPECTGKTSLAKQLSDTFGCPWVPEVARTYLKQIGRNYVFEDLLKIAQIQHQAELDHLDQEHGSCLLCDTDITVVYLWSIDKFGKVEAELERLFREVHYDYYLLCYPDISWEADGLREDEGRRAELFKLYETTLQGSNKDYIVVKGSMEERLAIVRTWIQEVDLKA